MIFRLLGACVSLVLLVTGSVHAQEKFAYKDLVPGETMIKPWYTAARAREHARFPGPHPLIAETVVCNERIDIKAIALCTDDTDEQAQRLDFFDGVLARVTVSYPGVNSYLDDIRAQLIAKYGKPTITTPMEFYNSYGANIPYDRLEWHADGKSLILNEIGPVLGTATLVVYVDSLVAKIKTLTTPNHI